MLGVVAGPSTGLSQAVSSAREAAVKQAGAPTTKTDFQSMLDSAEKTSSDMSNDVGSTPIDGLAPVKVSASTESTAVGPAKINQENPVTSGVKGLINSLNSSNDAMNRVFTLAMSHTNLTNQQMLALQAATYKATTVMQASAKLVEKGVDAAQQTLRTQV